MKVLSAILSTALLVFLSSLVYMLDQWTGFLAFTGPYLLFCLLMAAVVGFAWMPLLNKRAYVAGLAAFAFLGLHLLVPPPSERILRTASIQLVPGTHEESIEKILEEVYEGSAYPMPQITKESDRVFVSLIHHEPGNCTALILQLKDGKVVGSEYMVD